MCETNVTETPGMTEEKETCYGPPTKKRKTINLFGAPDQSDVTLIVGNHRIPVIKIVLSLASPVFKTMFESEFAEKEKTEIELPGKNFDSFVKFLKCVYPDKDESVSEQNVNEILPLAHEYQVRKLLLSCEKVLLDLVARQYLADKTEQVFKSIKQAETYGLNNLKTKCLYLASELSLQELEFMHFTVSAENQAEIYRLALKRNEMIRKDWAFFLNPKYNERLKNTLVETIKGKLSYRDNIYKAARLWFYCLQEDKDLKQKILSVLKSQNNFGEELDLLPESLKKELSLSKKPYSETSHCWGRHKFGPC